MSSTGSMCAVTSKTDHNQAEQLPPAQNPRQPYAVTSTSAADRFAGPFHCTYPTCEADVNDRTFEGKGAKAAYKFVTPIYGVLNYCRHRC